MPHEPGHSEEEHSSGEEHRALQPETAPTWQIDIAEGCEVVTRDGDKVGTVKEVRGGYFKVNAPLQPDYWLQRQFVESNAEGRITLSFEKGELGDYKVKDLPEAPVAQGQDANADDRAGALGFQERQVGGAVRNPEEGPGENPASATLRAVERRND